MTEQWKVQTAPDATWRTKRQPSTSSSSTAATRSPRRTDTWPSTLGEYVRRTKNIVGSTTGRGDAGVGGSGGTKGGGRVGEPPATPGEDAARAKVRDIRRRELDSAPRAVRPTLGRRVSSPRRERPERSRRDTRCAMDGAPLPQAWAQTSGLMVGTDGDAQACSWPPLISMGTLTTTPLALL